jgi:carboxyl-terminal processing protease
MDKESSLNLARYRTEQKMMRTTFKELDTLAKIPVDLRVTNPASDSIRISGDKDKLEKNKQWIKRVSDDIYVDETVKVIDNMIGQMNLAKVK